MNMNQLKNHWNKLCHTFYHGSVKEHFHARVNWREAAYSFLQTKEPLSVRWDKGYTQCTLNNVLVFIVEEPNERRPDPNLHQQ